MVASLTLDLAVVWANVLVAFISCFCAGWAARHGQPPRRVLHGVVAALSMVYALAYMVLLIDFPAMIVAWTRYKRGLDLFAWVLVWIVPSVFDVRLQRKRTKTANDLAVTVADRLGEVA